MSKGKIVGIGVLAFIAVIAVVAVLTISNLDSLVKKAIETAGTHVTQTDVSVSDVKIGLTEGSGAINGLTVANPEGFSNGKAFSLGGISVKIDPKTVTKDPIVISEVIVHAPKVLYEINASGKSNLEALKANIQQSVPQGDKTTEKQESTSQSPNIMIKKLVIESGQADVKLGALMDKEMTAKMPRIQMENIGEKEGGANPAEIGQKVLDTMMTRLAGVISNLGIEQMVNAELKKKLGNVGGQVGEKLEDFTKGMKDTAGGTLGEQADKAKDTLKGILNK